MAKAQINFGELGGGGAVVLVDWYSNTLSPTPTGQTYPQDGNPLVCPISGTCIIDVADTYANNIANPQLKKNGVAVSPTIADSDRYCFFCHYEFQVSAGDELLFYKGNTSKWAIFGIIDP